MWLEKYARPCKSGQTSLCPWQVGNSSSRGAPSYRGPSLSYIINPSSIQYIYVLFPAFSSVFQHPLSLINLPRPHRIPRAQQPRIRIATNQPTNERCKECCFATSTSPLCQSYANATDHHLTMHFFTILHLPFLILILILVLVFVLVSFQLLERDPQRYKKRGEGELMKLGDYLQRNA